MAGNATPIFSRVGDVTADGVSFMNQGITAAANDYTGAGANNVLVWTADATNGGFIQRLRFKAKGTNVATVARIYLNNGGSALTASNNAFFDEIALPATTAIANAATPTIDLPMNIALPPGFKVIVGLGTAVAAGWTVVPVAGKY